jgi:hypothetical protein
VPLFFSTAMGPSDPAMGSRLWNGPYSETVHIDVFNRPLSPVAVCCSATDSLCTDCPVEPLGLAGVDCCLLWHRHIS